MSAPTPGPWEAVSNVVRSHFTGTEGGIEIATCALWWGDDVSLANARLIAAAPDLYLACMAAFDDDDDQPIQGCTRDMLRTALAKAEGR